MEFTINFNGFLLEYEQGVVPRTFRCWVREDDFDLWCHPYFSEDDLATGEHMELVDFLMATYKKEWIDWLRNQKVISEPEHTVLESFDGMFKKINSLLKLLMIRKPKNFLHYIAIAMKETKSFTEMCVFIDMVKQKLSKVTFSESFRRELCYVNLENAARYH